jgi:hypothetical protein
MSWLNPAKAGLARTSANVEFTVRCGYECVVGRLVVVVAALAVAAAAMEHATAPKMPTATAVVTATQRKDERLIRLVDGLDMIVLLSVRR